MYWGAGPALGLLTILGYLFFALGAALLWRNREEVFVWVHDGISIFRRNFSRYTAVGRFYALREDSRLKALPSCFAISFRRMPRGQFYPGAILLLIGPLLFLLDFFI